MLWKYVLFEQLLAVYSSPLIIVESYNVLTGWSTNNPSNVSVPLNFGYDIFSYKCRLVEKKPKYVIFEI